jgi:hypothetical protein
VFLGEGNDRIFADKQYRREYESALENYNTIETGDGNDSIGSNGRFVNRGNIFLGDGNDGIGGDGFYNYNNIEGGDGNDYIGGIGFVYNEGVINTGKGNDSIYTEATVLNRGNVFLGENDDSIISEGTFANRGNVFLGEGNDSITANKVFYSSDRAIENFSFIGTGDGNDIITSYNGMIIYNEGVIETGNGDDSIIVDGGVDDITGNTYSIYNNGGAINMGDGNDSIIANEGFESAPNSSGAWFLGEGDDYILGYGSGDFYGGSGNDTLELTPGTYTVGIWGEAGESPIFTKGDQLMITSEFEKLKVGSTIYDFTSLTAGQIIIVA